MFMHLGSDKAPLCFENHPHVRVDPRQFGVRTGVCDALPGRGCRDVVGVGLTH